MPLLDEEVPIRKGSIRGRETRNQTVSTKLTDAEYRALEKVSAKDGKTAGEWLRDLALRRLRNGADNIEIIALSEFVGVRLLLVNALRSLATGQKLSTEAFDKLLDEIGATKQDLAIKLVAERRS